MHLHHPGGTQFSHRSNKDGTIDSICRCCFATTGSSTWEATLERIEFTHVCDPVRLYDLNARRKRIVLDAGISNQKCDPHSGSAAVPANSHSRRISGKLS